MMRIWLDVQASGVTTGPGPVVEVAAFSSRARLNQAGDWRATVPALDERVVELLQPRRTVLAYAMVNGARTFIGGGTIEALHVTIADGAPMLEVSGRDLLEELNRGTVGDVVLSEPAGIGISWSAFIGANLPAGWVSTSSNLFVSTFVANYSYDTLLGALTAITDKLPIWFRLQPDTVNGPRYLQLLGQLLAPATVRAVANADPVAIESNDALCLITNITEQRQAADISTRVIGFGSGNGRARLSMAAASQWPDGSALTGTYVIDGDSYAFSRTDNAITNTTAETIYGRIERALAWKEIGPISNTDADVEAAANTLVAAVCEHLRRNRAPVYVYSLSVAGVRQSILPGHLVRVQVRQVRDGQVPINIDRDLRVLEVATTVDENGIRTDGLTVATIDHWPAGDVETLVSEIRQSQVMQALPQMSASVDTISYREPIDDDYSADLRFWLGNETTSVNQVLVRFRVDPFRSTAKTVGGTVSGTVDIPNHDHDIPDHQHRLKIIGNGAGALAYNIGFGAGGTSGGVRHNINSTDWDWVTNADSGSTTSNDGGGQSGLALDLSTALSLQYGIYEDSGANTYAATDLEWLVNGSAASGAVVATTGGWYELDITADIADGDTYRPNQAANAVTVRVRAASKVGKRCQVTAQIERRTVIQAIAYI